MFDINKTIEELKKKTPYFASEAHLQMSFVAVAMEQDEDKEFTFIPEYPIKRNTFNGKVINKKDEIDLVIIDKKGKKTFIEFKHKTYSNQKTKSVKIMYGDLVIKEDHIPTNMGAVDLGGYDCWSDIERLQYYKDNNECDKAYFIFITNDKRYWDGNDSSYVGFSITENDRGSKKRYWEVIDKKTNVTKKIDPNDENEINKYKDSLKKNRIVNTPLETNDYSDQNPWFDTFIEGTNDAEYRILIVDIK